MDRAELGLDRGEMDRAEITRIPMGDTTRLRLIWLATDVLRGAGDVGLLGEGVRVEGVWLRQYVLEDSTCSLAPPEVQIQLVEG